MPHDIAYTAGTGKTTELMRPVAAPDDVRARAVRVAVSRVERLPTPAWCNGLTLRQRLRG